MVLSAPSVPPSETRLLHERYGTVLFDIDGTVVVGRAAVPGADVVVTAVRRTGVAVRYVTNNASRSPAAVAAVLRAAGLPADPAEISTSAQAAAALLRERLPARASVLVLGASALRTEVEAVGLRTVDGADDRPAAVVQGFSPDIGWRALAEATLAVRAGAFWVACNRDVTLPGARGLLPGNGALVAAVAAATGAEPTVAGKPHPTLFANAAGGAGDGPVLVVGDRLDTDVAGAAGAGYDAMAVLTGVTGGPAALAAPPAARPRYLATDVTALCRPLTDSLVAPQEQWAVRRADDGGLWLHARPRAGRPPCAASALRALCAAWWPVAEGLPPSVRAGDAVAGSALAALRRLS